MPSSDSIESTTLYEQIYSLFPTPAIRECMAKSDPRKLVSVIIPTYNDEEYLPRAVDSVLSQEYSPLEILLIDSSDSTVATELSRSHANVHHHTTPPNGPGAARNAGIDRANGEFISFLDADDEWLSHKIARQVQTIEETDADFVFSEEYLEPESGERKHLTGISFPADEPPHEYYFRKGTGIGSRTVLVRSKCLAYHRFSEDLPAREDPHLWTRLLRRCEPVKISEPLAIKHARHDSLTNDREIVWRAERRSINDLADRYADLSPYRDARLSEADYRFAKRLLVDGNTNQARTVLRQLDKQHSNMEPRVLALLAVSYLPIGHNEIIMLMDRIHKRV